MGDFHPLKQLFKVDEAKEILGMSRSTLYEQMRAVDAKGRPRLRSVHQGRACLIPLSAIHDYVALLEREAQHDQAA